MKELIPIRQKIQYKVLLKKTTELVRHTFYSPAVYKGKDVKILAGCLGCPDTPCIISSERNNSKFLVGRNICSTDAISFDYESNIPKINHEQCMKCGLCLFNCNYGAFYFKKDLSPQINIFKSYEIVNCTEKDFKLFIDKTNLVNKVSREEKVKILKYLFKNQNKRNKELYYPLIEKLLQSIDFDVRTTRIGDTNNRVDAFIIDKKYSIPIEIKSPGETDNIDVKSIRQALENKIILLSREFYKTNYNITSLSIGYKCPPDRSDVTELIEDIYRTYGIKIGILGLNDLLELLWRKYVEDIPLDKTTIENLKGRFHMGI